jgi:hypothetical protein
LCAGRGRKTLQGGERILCSAVRGLGWAAKKSHLLLQKRVYDSVQLPALKQARSETCVFPADSGPAW